MSKMIKLYDVIDTRTDTYYSVAIVSEKKAKYFIPADEVEENE